MHTVYLKLLLRKQKSIYTYIDTQVAEVGTSGTKYTLPLYGLELVQ